MKQETADVVVVGCGAAGLSAAATLAARGRRVIGLERFEFGHTRGSSHGTERIVRVPYTDAVHVAMAVASLEGWRRIERDSGAELLRRTGGLDIGDRSELEALVAQCEAADVDIDWLTPADVRRRFPMFHFDLSGESDRHAIHHRAACTVHADEALAALRRIAELHGAEFHTGVRVGYVESLADDHVIVHHDGGTVTASTCIVATGAWAGDGLVRAALGDDPRLPALRVTQEQVAFYRPTGVWSWPTFIDRATPSIYGLPTPDGLVKVAEHHTGPDIDPDEKSDLVEPTTWSRLQEWVAEHVPGLDPAPLRSATCLYAGYPGDTFLFDRVGAVVAGLGLSGHGFKFVPEIGRLLADLADGASVGHNPFGLDRPSLDVGSSGHR